MVAPAVEFRVEAQVAAPGTGRRRGPVFRDDVVVDGRTERTFPGIPFKVDPGRTVALDRVANDVLLGDW